MENGVSRASCLSITLCAIQSANATDVQPRAQLSFSTRSTQGLTGMGGDDGRLCV